MQETPTSPARVTPDGCGPGRKGGCTYLSLMLMAKGYLIFQPASRIIIVVANTSAATCPSYLPPLAVVGIAQLHKLCCAGEASTLFHQA